MERGEVEWARELTQGLVNEKGVVSTAVCLPLHCAEPKGTEMMAWGCGCGSVGRTLAWHSQSPGFYTHHHINWAWQHRPVTQSFLAT